MLVFALEDDADIIVLWADFLLLVVTINCLTTYQKMIVPGYKIPSRVRSVRKRISHA